MEGEGRGRERIYVDVETFFDRTGHMNPRAIYWKDGRRFDIQAVRDFRPAYKAGNDINGDCFTIVINGQERYLFSYLVCNGKIDIYKLISLLIPHLS